MVNWTDDAEVLDQIRRQIIFCFDELVTSCPDLADGYLSGRYALVFNREGVERLEGQDLDLPEA